MCSSKSLNLAASFSCSVWISAHQCDVCTFRSPTKVSQWRHRCESAIRPSEVKAQHCPYCNVGSYSILWLYFHLKKYNGKCKAIARALKSRKWYECDQCNMKYKRSAGLKHHKEKKHAKDLGNFKCSQCPYATTLRRCLKYHISSKHKTISFDCPYCNYVARFKYHLNDHVYHTHTPEELVKRFPCPYCEKTIKRMGDLNRHIKQKHPNGDAEEEMKKTFKCDQCRHKCPTLGYLQMHILSDHSNEEFSIDDI